MTPRVRTAPAAWPCPGLLAAAALLVLLAAAGMGTASARGRMATVAVFPVENLSGGGAPVGDIRQFVIERLSSAGVAVLGDEALESFMARHRVRYTAGIDAATAELLKREEGVDGVVFASLELFSELAPPKVALTVRLVSIAAAPVVVWADDAGLAGDDAPGVPGPGPGRRLQVLLTRALDRLSASLARPSRNGGGRAGSGARLQVPARRRLTAASPSSPARRTPSRSCLSST